MKKCTGCQYFKVLDHKEEEMGCSMPSEEMTDIVCLLRRILWQAGCIEHAINEQTKMLEADEDDEDDDDEKWKV